MDCHGIYCHYCLSSVLFFKIVSAIKKLRLGYHIEWKTEKGLITPAIHCRISVLPVHSTYALCLSGNIPHGKGPW